MPPMDFPASPTIGQVFINTAGIVYRWDGTAWVLLPGSPTLLQAYDKIYARIKSQIPACPDALIRQEVTDIMLDFTQDTNLWQETLPLEIVPNQLIYPFAVSSGTPNRLMLVYKDGDENQRWADNYISMRVPGVLTLYRKVSTAVLWQVIVAKATSTALLDDDDKDTGYPVIDQWIVDQHSDTIYYGAMWLLQRMPAKSFRDPNGAKENSMLYNSMKSRARGDGIRLNTYNGQAWSYPQSFATITRKGWA